MISQHYVEVHLLNGATYLQRFARDADVAPFAEKALELLAASTGVLEVVHVDENLNNTPTSVTMRRETRTIHVAASAIAAVAVTRIDRVPR